jgi:hypothetical protein
MKEERDTMNTKHTPELWYWDDAVSIKHAERGAVTDGDDEKEMFFELCSKVYGGGYVRVFMSPRFSNR